MIQSVSTINQKFRRQALIWLIMAGVMLVLWLLVSLFNNTPSTVKEHKKTEATAQDFALPTTIENLSELSKEVSPIDFATVVRDLRNYPEEFKGKKFFIDNQNRWTVQVMDVTQNEIITEYLKGRSDRNKFSYFRYHNSNNEQRYILTYGIMGSTQEAIGAIKTVDFGLPKSVQPMPEQMKRYIDIIDNYERSEAMLDFSEETPRAVKLKPTKKEIPAEAPKAEEKNEKSVTEKNIADLDAEEGGDEDNTTKLKAPPTITPKEEAEKPKANTKESQNADKPEGRSEPKASNESKNDKPAPVKESNVADLDPAPPMVNTNTPSIPGDD